ncbi:MAG: hypothetical protein KY464_18200, partial [Gemmatimonadetes bacterium]|nr:hypothetical protein [Gemmatimonadota bacterium]
SLIHYNRQGEFTGDTWHHDAEDAVHQAEYEFGNFLGSWREVPPDVENVEEFALSEVLRGTASEMI